MRDGRVTMADLRAAGFCAAGVRAFCTRHGIDYAELLRAGIPFDVAEHTGDAMVITLIQRLRDGR